ncbi:Arc family DNA-binding protein [Stenotrophomonas bentonitica]|uniref:Arc family DNA-binding protein n=2 Tax=Stenotrophomonas bentonitica TaxID=1450134 RepID=UPI0031B9ECA9
MLPAMARTDPQVNFRIPAELLEKIKEQAAANNRTITAELVSRLELSFGETAFGPDWQSDLAVKFRELINPALVEMSKIENETRLKLAVSGLTQEEIAKAMAVKVDPAEIQKKRAGKGSKKP